MRLPGSIAEVQASPPGPEIGAFFDLDGTLVAGFTGVRLTQDTFRRREIGARDRSDSRRTQETAPCRIPCAIPRPPSRTGLGRRVIGNSEGLPGDLLRRIKERGEQYEG
jgi:hypothetical protein